MAESPHRRRQRADRHPQPDQEPETTRTKPRRADPVERGLRDLVGGSPSQVGVGGALRARDVNRPSEDDLAEAERDVVIVRRGWKPPN
jgi:hypothetical protein